MTHLRSRLLKHLPGKIEPYKIFTNPTNLILIIGFVYFENFKQLWNVVEIKFRNRINPIIDHLHIWLRLVSKVCKNPIVNNRYDPIYIGANYIFNFNNLHTHIDIYIGLGSNVNSILVVNVRTTKIANTWQYSLWISCIIQS